jgi:hypothetical protein
MRLRIAPKIVIRVSTVLTLSELTPAAHGMESVPGAIATRSRSQLIARIEIVRIVTRSLSLPVLTSYSSWDAPLGRARNKLTTGY